MGSAEQRLPGLGQVVGDVGQNELEIGDVTAQAVCLPVVVPPTGFSGTADSVPRILSQLEGSSSRYPGQPPANHSSGAPFVGRLPHGNGVPGGAGYPPGRLGWSRVNESDHWRR